MCVKIGKVLCARHLRHVWLRALTGLVVKPDLCLYKHSISFELPVEVILPLSQGFIPGKDCWLRRRTQEE